MSPDAPAERQALATERVVRWDGEHVTVDGDSSFRIEVLYHTEALAEAVLKLAECEDATPQETEAFCAFLPLGSFTVLASHVARWCELYRAQKGLWP